MQAQIPGASPSAWFIELVLGLVLLVFCNYLAKRLIKKVKRKVRQGSWHERVDTIFFVPLNALLWIFAGLLVIDIVSREFSIGFVVSYMGQLRATAIIITLAWAILRWTKALHERKILRSADSSFVHLWGKTVTVMIVILAAMTILQLWGLNIAPLITFGGVGAAAVGFASKDVISNFCGGLMLSLTRPFVTGDFIQIQALSLEGHVEEIGWYLTSVRDKDKRAVYLPNSIFSSALVMNASRMTHRRIQETVGVRYTDVQHVESLVSKIESALKACPEVDKTLPILVSLTTLNTCSLDVGVDLYTKTTDLVSYTKVRQAVLLKMYEEVRKMGIDLASPLLEVVGLQGKE